MVYKEETTIKDHVIKARIGTVVAVTTVLVSTLIGAGIGYEKIQARLRHLTGKTALYQTQFDALEKRVSQNESNIQLHYLDIKKDLDQLLKAVK